MFYFCIFFLKNHSFYGLLIQCGEEGQEKHEETLIIELIAGGGKVCVAFIANCRYFFVIFHAVLMLKVMS